MTCIAVRIRYSLVELLDDVKGKGKGLALIEEKINNIHIKMIHSWRKSHQHLLPRHNERLTLENFKINALTKHKFYTLSGTP